MHFYQFDGSCLFVQGIDVLRYEEKLTAAIAVPSLELGEREVGRVRLRPQCSEEALAVPLPRANGVAPEKTKRRHLRDVPCPNGTFIGAAKGRDAAGDTDARTGQHEHQSPLSRDGVD